MRYLALPNIIAAERSSAPALLSTLTVAFAADPVFRFWWPEPAEYLKVWPSFALAMGERGFDAKTVLATSDARAVAFWLPPGIEANPEQIAALDLGGSPEDDEIARELRSEMDRYHPAAPHWYLWLIGVDPIAQGRGLGSHLLRHTLATCDELGEIAYLESSDPSNVPFYERHGFEPLAEIRVRDVPVVTPMIRHPR
ncbi:MAG: GNAT family N-acetyltransferase [Phenylobacterium sp.]|uniref:GNAT family N-acetyltransferase n=1 Tax=Phenylobacterium sp. TaxID=1871053 RepID=UPI0025DBA34E|nr:GNAT family N-acetyltransferase [Phenylobacterium sp.]MCG9917430.1 GNAT family N-acetyltransferase [Phenylobacterium sp.]